MFLSLNKTSLYSKVQLKQEKIDTLDMSSIKNMDYQLAKLKRKPIVRQFVTTKYTKNVSLYKNIYPWVMSHIILFLIKYQQSKHNILYQNWLPSNNYYWTREITVKYA